MDGPAEGRLPLAEGMVLTLGEETLGASSQVDLPIQHLVFFPAPAGIQNIPRVVFASREPALASLKGFSVPSSLWDQRAQWAMAEVVLWQEVLSPVEELPRDLELFIPGFCL